MQDSFQNLLTRLWNGDESAAASVFHEFASRLVGLARTRLGDRFRQKVDPEDVVQSVYKSFFWRVADGQFGLQDWDSLWTLLTVITLRKCGHQSSITGPRVEMFSENRVPSSATPNRRCAASRPSPASRNRRRPRC